MRRLTRKTGLRLTGVSIVGVAVLVAANGPGVFAGLKAEADTVANPMAATTGTLVLGLDGVATFDDTVAGMKPGDSGARYIRLDNTGTLAARNLKVKIGTSGDSVLTAGSKALSVAITSCDQAFSSGTCGGSSQTQVSETVVSGYADFVSFSNSPVLSAADANSTSDSIWLKVVVKLPDTDETTSNGAAPSGTVQGKSANLTYTFQQAQQVGVDAL